MIPDTTVDTQGTKTGVRFSSWYFLSIFTLVTTLSWADRQVFVVLFPAFQKPLGISDTQFGILSGAAFALVFAVAALPFGWAADRLRRKNVMGFGLAFWSLAAAATGLASNFATLFGARFATGIGEASAYPSAMSMIAERFPLARRARAIGIFTTSLAAGTGLGAVIGGILFAVVGWRNVFFLYGAVGVFLLPLVLSIPEQRRLRLSQESNDPSAPPVDNILFLPLLKNGKLISLWCCTLVSITATVGYGAWLPTFLVRVRHMSVTEAGVLTGVASLLGGVLGSLLGGWLADRRGAQQPGRQLEVSALAALIAAPLLLIVLLVPSVAIIAVCALLGALAYNAYTPAIVAVMGEMVPARQRGQVFAINIAVQAAIGGTLGPLLVGYISDKVHSLMTALFVSVAIELLAVFVTLVAITVIRRERGTEIEEITVGEVGHMQ